MVNPVKPIPAVDEVPHVDCGLHIPALQIPLVDLKPHGAPRPVSQPSSMAQDAALQDIGDDLVRLTVALEKQFSKSIDILKTISVAFTVSKRKDAIWMGVQHHFGRQLSLDPADREDMKHLKSIYPRVYSYLQENVDGWPSMTQEELKQHQAVLKARDDATKQRIPPLVGTELDTLHQLLGVFAKFNGKTTQEYAEELVKLSVIYPATESMRNNASSPFVLLHAVYAQLEPKYNFTSGGTVQLVVAVLTNLKDVIAAKTKKTGFSLADPRFTPHLEKISKQLGFDDEEKILFFSGESENNWSYMLLHAAAVNEDLYSRTWLGFKNVLTYSVMPNAQTLVDGTGLKNVSWDDFQERWVAGVFKLAVDDMDEAKKAKGKRCHLATVFQTVILGPPVAANGVALGVDELKGFEDVVTRVRGRSILSLVAHLKQNCLRFARLFIEHKVPFVHVFAKGTVEALTKIGIKDTLSLKQFDDVLPAAGTKLKDLYKKAKKVVEEAEVVKMEVQDDKKKTSTKTGSSKSSKRKTDDGDEGSKKKQKS